MAQVSAYAAVPADVDPATADVPVGGYVCRTDHVTFDADKPVTTLTVRNLRDLPTLRWMGKGRKQRDAELSPSTVDALGRYLTAYRDKLGRPLSDDDPLFCKANNRHTISFGKPIPVGTPSGTGSTPEHVRLDSATSHPTTYAAAPPRSSGTPVPQTAG